ncbi:MAG: D-aminoacyl-tRNA deacylase [Eubacteriales bacterium]|nr:D-aminoacyl-tRNA deacylase [Eubacteriales bacterium]
MRAVVQRVSGAQVTVEEDCVGSVGKGLLVLLGVEEGDGQADLDYICAKVAGLRIFEDEQDKMNLDVKQAGGAVLLVSQFTLCGDARKGRRPSFSHAASPQEAQRWYELAADALRAAGLRVKTGRFQTHMMVSLTNDGPVTILLDSRRRF